MSRIAARFKELQKRGGKAFIPYIMAGDPSLEKTREHLQILEECGADIVELGVPFSDPLADGPTIQAAADRAIKAGVNLPSVLAFVKEIRSEIHIPIILMTYYNPIFKHGDEAFFREAKEAGVDGVIIPDMTVEESGEFLPFARKHGIDTIFLAAPTSGTGRLKKVAKVSTGFIYYVSITGITGAQLVLTETTKNSIDTLKKSSGGKPVALGFGVSTPEEAAQAAALADGVIVGSAIVKQYTQGNMQDFREYIKALREAIK